MSDVNSILTDIGRVAHSSVRRRVFWYNYTKLTLGMVVLAAMVFWPIFQRARKADRIQLTRIYEDRRQVMENYFGRVSRLFYLVRLASTVEQRKSTLQLIRELDRYPGIVAIGLTDFHDGVHQVDPAGLAVMMDDSVFATIFRDPAFQETLSEATQTGSNHVSKIFWHGPPTDDAERAYFVFAIPGMRLLEGESGSPSKVLFAVVNLKRWIVNTGRPASLNLVDIYLSNKATSEPSIKMDRVVELKKVPRKQLIELRNDNPADTLYNLEGQRLLEQDNLENDLALDESFGTGKIGYLRILDFPNREFQIKVMLKKSFLKASAIRALAVAIPYYLLQIFITSFLMILMWTVFSASRSQMRELAEAQGTIARLNLHRTLVQQELHDHIIQNLTLLGVQVATSRIDDVNGFKRTRDTILQQLDYLRRELRRLLVEGTERLQSFDEMSVQLESICKHMEKQFNVRCQLTTSNAEGLSLHPEVLFRTCRFAEELLGNAIRHGRARNISLRVECVSSPPSLFLRVLDDGCGFDPANYSAGFGLQSMIAFARRSRGQIRIERRELKGMFIELTVPVKSLPVLS
jgi:signal transduction histidine kinase